MRVAINGCGIAGPALAWWLKRFGHEPVLFERATAPREGGYLIDFWGHGYDIAEEMGLIPTMRAEGYLMERLRSVGPDGRTRSVLDGRVFDALTGGRYLSIARSGLARVLREACAGVEAHYGRHVAGFDTTPDAVGVRLSDDTTERFDLLVGADGLHSAVRGQLMPDAAEFATGLHVVAGTIAGYPVREELTYAGLTRKGAQVSRVALRGDRTLVLFVFRGAVPDGADPMETVAHIFAGMGWETEALIAAARGAADLYSDPVAQIRLDAWYRGRVALLGDAGACVSLLAGEGAALAMASAYVLAGELASVGDPAVALARWQACLAPHIAAKQRNALRLAGFFAPGTSIGATAREILLKISSHPALARRLIGGMLTDSWQRPRYTSPQARW